MPARRQWIAPPRDIRARRPPGRAPALPERNAAASPGPRAPTCAPAAHANPRPK
ncbi:hypothetical protein BURPS668_A1087 [Burkholderia pseudomallei 668]|nr:hypothetical protein BURPS668_A1087 [Burkholderia pseudomallei 668]